MRALLALVLLVGGAVEAGADPWPIGKGRVYLNLAYGRLDTTRLASPDGSLFDIPEFSLDEWTTYGAVGLDDRVTLEWSGTFYRESAIDRFDSASGVGDLRVGAKVFMGRLGAWLFGARGLVQAPTGDATKGGSLLPTGSGVWEGVGLVSVGRSFAAGTLYAFVDLGHNVRGGGLRDAFYYDGQVGVNAGDRVVVMWNVRGMEPYEKAPGRAALNSPAGLGDGVTYTVVGPSVIVKVAPRWGVQVSGDTTLERGSRNIAPGTTVRVALSFSR